MSEVPVISINNEIEDTFEGEDDRPDINNCHTDVEDLDSDNENKKITLITMLKTQNKCNGAVTDIEDCEDSEDDSEPKEEANYEPEISLDEFLDQGLVDEHSNLQGNVKKQKMQKMQSLQKAASPTAFNLCVNNADIGGTTDVEDIEGSGEEEEEEEKVYSDDDKAVVLEDGNSIDVHDSMNRKKQDSKLIPKVIEPSSSSSSDSEEDTNKCKSKAFKHLVKRGVQCKEAKSDVENIYFSDDEKCNQSAPKTKSTPVLETPDIEVMAFEGSDVDENENERQFPEINITFMSSGSEKKQKKNKYKTTPAPSPMLKLPENPDEALTDVENLNSSDDDEEEDEGKIKLRPKSLLPLAVVKSDALTDVEDFDDDDDIGDDENEEKSPEIDLPTPVREITVLVENETGEPYKQTTPLPDNLLLGFDDLDADKGLTDVEDFSDSYNEDDEDEEDNSKKREFQIPELDGGIIESSDHAVVKDSKMRISNTPEPKTDTEDIFVNNKNDEKHNDCRRRRGKNKHRSAHGVKSNFLDTKFYVDADSAHTDVEDLQVEDDDVLLKDKCVKQRRATIECSPMKFNNNGDDKTDTEEFSEVDDNNNQTDIVISYTPDIVRSINVQIDTNIVTMSSESSCKNSNIPEIRRISATPQITPRGSFGTDIECFQCDSENEEFISYIRAHTPIEINHELNELCASVVQHVNKHGLDHALERMEIKDYHETAEAHTDVEFID
ncbi:hypothetical protein PVAND_010429 [Polypedilum vanderplanki]|uniref:Uncharacterized protein n=1 Tax=Polypedilum vanderplanki TaxID=319348 RepID=A0A9J6CFM0_POLVA|nr:hypothetical protein PVAND_010429 [Polypedilum vanderplanki]